MAKEDINRGPKMYTHELERVVRYGAWGEPLQDNHVNPESRAAVLRTVRKQQEEQAKKQQPNNS